jgi:CheY-like chemotaxis protein
MSKRLDGRDGRVILIVDADAQSRRIVQDLLSHHGRTTIAAASGDEALSVARSIVLSLVVSELYVACREHSCFVHALYADPQLRKVPVVVFTAFAMPVDEEWAQRAEVGAYLTKPAALSSLLAEVDRLSRPRDRPANRAH